MLNGIIVFIVLAAILLGAATGQMQAVTKAILDSSIDAAQLAIKLIGVMAFFLGLMRVAEDAGLLRLMARAIGPLMRKLFPSVPSDHPAMSAMILNISANMLGLANAATPFGIKAIEHLDTLNTRKGTATNAMVLFLAINTAGLAILPTGVIGLRATLGSENATAIFLPTWVASGSATIVGILAAILLSRLPRYRRTQPPDLPPDQVQVERPGSDEPQLDGAEPRASNWRRLLVAGFWLAFAVLLVLHLMRSVEPAGDLLRGLLSAWTLPILVGLLVLFGWSRGVKVYESMVEGAKEGFDVAKRIIPFLVTILTAVGMFRASGGIDLISRWVGPVTSWIGLPAEALPMALLRPLTGSGAYGVMAEIMTENGPDSFIGYMVSTFQGSTETTFYVLAVYFGAVGIKRTRHAMPACLMADAAGIMAAVFIVNLLFG